MRTPSLQRARDERGQAAVELALVLPILILLVFGIAWFSIGFNRKQGLQAAAREGARIGALPQTTRAEIEARVMAALAGSVPETGSGAAAVTITPSGDQPCDLVSPGATVEVTVTAQFEFEIPLWGSRNLLLSGKGEFKCE